MLTGASDADGRGADATGAGAGEGGAELTAMPEGPAEEVGAAADEAGGAEA